MFRRYFFPILASIAFVFSTSFLAAAQNGQLRGHVTLKQADGTIVPAANALVDVFRWDLGGEYNLKTGKSGDFVHAGLPVVGTYVISVSMPGAQAYYVPDVKAGREAEYKIELSPGDGKRLTKAEIKTLLAKTPGGAPTGGGKDSAEDKAKRAELLKKNEEITASNKKVEEANEVVNRTLKAGNEALKANNFDTAITQYNEGLAADPEHPGAPVLLTNKTIALTYRGTEKYNAAVKNPDEAARNAGTDSAKKDWTEANESGAKAVAMLKALPAPTDAEATNRAKLSLYLALAARANAMRLFVPKVDPTQADAGAAAYEEYIAAETDPVKKPKAEHDMAKMLFDANAYDKSKVVYDKILAQSPDDVEALQNEGLILYNLGFAKESEGKKDEAKALYQEAANYFGRFVDKAPEGQNKTDAQAILKNMKENQNVQAEKVSTPTRRRRP